MSQTETNSNVSKVYQKYRRRIELLMEEQRMDDYWADHIQDKVDVAFMTRKMTGEQYNELCNMLPN